ncbi:MAG: tRNA lysidine(34) synthetase TilS [Candidatus Dasytiphilus stammeri]
MKNRILNVFKKQLEFNGYFNLLIAYSGGIDSTVLLHQLTQLRKYYLYLLKFRAIHINHNINPNANLWRLHCQEQCLKWNIVFSSVEINLDSKNKKDKGIEAASRIARYNALFKALLPGEILLTAHHMDDQSESFLLALKRGSGPSGLSSMPLIKKNLEGKILFRPFLNHDRKTIEKWANQYNLCWINDNSNNDTYFDRNFLRVEVLSVLKNKWPHFCKAVTRSAKLCAYQEQLLHDLLTEHLQKITRDDGSLIIDDLHHHSEIKVYAILRQWLMNHKIMAPSFKIIQCIWREIICSRKDALACIRIGPNEIRRYHNAIYLLATTPSIKEHILDWKSPWQPLQLPNKLGVIKLHHSHGILMRSPNILSEKVSIRFKAKGKFLLLGRSAGRRSIKKIWQEFAIPYWLRERIPLIFYNEILIAAMDVFITQEGYTANKKLGWYLKWDKKTVS